MSFKGESTVNPSHPAGRLNTKEDPTVLHSGYALSSEAFYLAVQLRKTRYRNYFWLFLPTMAVATPSQTTLLTRWLFLNLFRLLGVVAIAWSIGIQVVLLLSYVGLP
jgi:hypothetical protein